MPTLGGHYKGRMEQRASKVPRRAIQSGILVCIVERMWVVAQKTLNCQTFGEDGFVRVQLDVEVGQR